MAVAALAYVAPRAVAQSGSGGEFAHPGLLHSRGELDFIRDKIRAGEEPWKSAWEALRKERISQLSWTARPRAEIVRGPYNSPDVGGTDLMRDAAAAYTHALQWCVTGQSAHAEAAAKILNAYSTTLKSIGGHDTRLLIGMVGINFLNAAELLRHTYDGWKTEERRRFETLMRTVFYPPIRDFAPTANGNWDAAILQTMIAMGVYLDDREIFHRAVDYYRHGRGNGAVRHYFNDFGQCQESGRDQGHTQMGLGYLGVTCEIAWKQGVDLYGLYRNRLALGYEYTARYNLGNEVPFSPYVSIDGKYRHKKISEKGRGRFAPIYERVYHHYHDRVGLDMPYTRQVLEKIRPERWATAFVPWGTLTSAGTPK